LFLQQLFGAPDVDFDAGHVRIDSQRTAPVLDRPVVLPEPEVDLAVARERAEVRGIALHHLVAVGERALELAGEVEDRGALVPAFGEPGRAADYVAENRDRLREMGLLHLLDAF